MEYGKIISVTGMNGLFELVGSKKDGAIVKSLEDKSTKFVSSRIHNFSHLESIEVYTVNDNVNLVELLQAMNNSSQPLPNDKDAASVKAYFEAVYPEMDFERVYASDRKKMVKWFNILKANDVEFKLEEVEEDTEADEADTLENSTPAENTTLEEVPAAKAVVAKKQKEEDVVVDPAAPEETDAAVKEASKKRAPRKKKATEG